MVFTKPNRQRFFQSNAEALAYIERLADVPQDIYFGVNMCMDSSSREQSNIAGCRALYLDVDAKDYQGSLSDAESAINGFIEQTGLPEPVRVCSGNGYHLYYLFNETITPDVWRRYAGKLEALCEHYGFKVDASVTTNSASLLRVPDTFNCKDAANLKRCELITEIRTFDFAAIKQVIETAASKLPNFKDALAVNDLFLSGIENAYTDNPQESREIARLCLPYLSLERCDQYDAWLQVGFALYNVFAGDDEGLRLWDEWSQQSGKYKPGACSEKWQSFGGERDKSLGVGSLVFWAREDSTDFQGIWEQRLAEKRRERLAAKANEIQLTDLGNAQRLITLHGENIRYDYERRVWYVWNGKFWCENSKARVLQFAKETVKAMYAEASQIQDDTRRQSLAKHAHKSEGANRIKALVELAESEAEIQGNIGDFDRQPHLLNVSNGVIDLRTGKLLPHTREMMLTNCVPVEYDQVAACPMYAVFLTRIFAGNERLIKYVQQALGYALTGETHEQCFFLCYGTGANGKSTLLETVHFLLNDLAGTVRTEALMKHGGNGGHNEDIAILRGKRFVTAAETESGQQLAESLIKQLTGGDTITASRKYGYSFSLKPQFKLWLAANHKPQVSGTDEGIWRRVKFIPFNVQIPENERDKQLKEKLQLEAKGILAWVVRGAVAWYAQGLEKVPEVENATAAYRSEQDSVINFIAEYCETGKGFSIKPSSLFDSYRAFCDESGYKPLNRRGFPARLEQLGYAKNDSRNWNGIRVKMQAVCPNFQGDAAFNPGGSQLVN